MKRIQRPDILLAFFLMLACAGTTLWLGHDGMRRSARQAQLNRQLIAAVESGETTGSKGQSYVGDLAAVHRLLDAGADPNARDGAARPRTWLRQALDRLLHRPPPLHDVGCPVLAQAAIDGNVPVVQALLARGADPNAHIRNGPMTTTALMEAVTYGQPQAISALIRGGADVNARCSMDLLNMTFHTPLSCAVEGDAPAQTIPLLLAHGADVNAVLDAGNHTILMDAVNWTPEKIASVKAILAGRPNLDVKSLDGTALTIASSQKATHIVVLLKQAGAQ